MMTFACCSASNCMGNGLPRKTEATAAINRADHAGQRDLYQGYIRWQGRQRRFGTLVLSKEKCTMARLQIMDLPVERTLDAEQSAGIVGGHSPQGRHGHHGHHDHHGHHGHHSHWGHHGHHDHWGHDGQWGRWGDYGWHWGSGRYTGTINRP